MEALTPEEKKSVSGDVGTPVINLKQTVKQAYTLNLTLADTEVGGR